MTTNYKLVGVLALVGLLIVFVIQNTAVVDIRILFWTLSMSRSLMFFLLVCIGIGIGWILRGHFRGNRVL